MSCFSCPVCGDILYETPDPSKENKKQSLSNPQPQPVFTFNKTGRVNHPFEFDLNTNRPDRGRRIAKIPIKPKSTIIAQCGHLFHKQCIEKYMRAYRLVSRRSVTECPICYQVLFVPSRNFVDFEASEDFGENIEVKFRVFTAVYGELQDQVHDVEVKLDDIEHKIKGVERLYKSLNPHGANIPADIDEVAHVHAHVTTKKSASPTKKLTPAKKPSRNRRKRSPIDIFAGPRLRAMHTDPNFRFKAYNNRFQATTISCANKRK